MKGRKLKAKDAAKLRLPEITERPKQATGHTVTRAIRVHKNERDYQRKRDKRIKDSDLE